PPQTDTLSLHDALPISFEARSSSIRIRSSYVRVRTCHRKCVMVSASIASMGCSDVAYAPRRTTHISIEREVEVRRPDTFHYRPLDRKSTRLNSSHVEIS